MEKAGADHLDTMLTFLRNYLAHINVDKKPHYKFHRIHTLSLTELINCRKNDSFSSFRSFRMGLE